MNQLIQSKSFTTFVILAMTLVCSAFPQQAQPQTNTAYGSGALVNLTSGTWNSAFGFEALNHDTNGNQNTATGVRALFSDTSGSSNTATGVYALYGNINGFFNNAVGAYSLANNTVGNQNTANGYKALYYNTQGDNNTANGLQALYSNTTGNFNIANGIQALLLNTTGSHNAAIGIQALDSNTTGSNNIAMGVGAGSNVTTADDLICIGASGANLNNSCYIGQIFGATSSGGTAVFINSDGKLGTTTSSRRFKEEIKPMERASEALFALKPMTFRYKKGIDPQCTPQFGLVAEDVEAVNPDLVVRDKEGKVNTVGYEAVNAMLLNEFLKEHRKVEELASTVAKQQATIAQQRRDFQAKIGELEATITAQLKEQAEQIQKVSAQIEASRSAPQVVLNNR